MSGYQWGNDLEANSAEYKRHVCPHCGLSLYSFPEHDVRQCERTHAWDELKMYCGIIGAIAGIVALWVFIATDPLGWLAQLEWKFSQVSTDARVIAGAVLFGAVVIARALGTRGGK